MLGTVMVALEFAPTLGSSGPYPEDALGEGATIPLNSGLAHSRPKVRGLDAEDEMTKKSKFKKRVRAQMEKTGERYTKTASSLQELPSDQQSLEHTLKALVSAKAEGALAVAQVLGAFHKQHHGSGEWEATFGSHAFECLWPQDASIPDVKQLRDLLGAYQKSTALEQTGVSERSDAHNQAFADEMNAHRHCDHQLLPVTFDSTPQEGDDAYYDMSAPLPSLGPEPEGVDIKGAEEVLLEMWGYAPDMSAQFGMKESKIYGWDRQGWEPPIKQDLEDSFFDKPSEGTLKVLDSEIRQLRRKLKDAGVDPDS